MSGHNATGTLLVAKPDLEVRPHRPGCGRGFSSCPLFQSYQLLYIPAMVCVLHCFQKKAQETSQKDIKLARKRYKELMRTRP